MFFGKAYLSKIIFVELLPLVSCFFILFVRENCVRSWAFTAFVAFSLLARKLNRQPAVTYEMGNREKAIDNKGSRELLKGFCLHYLSEMFIRGLNIHDKHQS